RVALAKAAEQARRVPGAEVLEADQAQVASQHLRLVSGTTYACRHGQDLAGLLEQLAPRRAQFQATAGLAQEQLLAKERLELGDRQRHRGLRDMLGSRCGADAALF